MHREQLHRIGLHRCGCLEQAALEGAHEVVGGGVARAVERERLRQQRVDGVERGQALLGRHDGGHTLADLAFEDDAVEQVVRRQLGSGALP